jgi:hypothetical protein
MNTSNGYLELEAIDVQNRFEVSAQKQEKLKQDRLKFESDAIEYVKTLSVLKRLKITLKLM